MNIGIDLITPSSVMKSFSIDEKAFTGGTNYAAAITNYFITHLPSEVTVYLVLPEDQQLSLDSLRPGLNKIVARTIDQANLSVVDLLFLPQVNGSCLAKIPRVQHRFPRLAIAGAILDRNHNLQGYDSYDSFYAADPLRARVVGPLRQYVKGIAFTEAYRRALPALDRVYTISNYSLQRLSDDKVRNLGFFIPLSESSTGNSSRGDYILFVSGSRAEKNLLRTLEAFCQFKKKTGSATRFVVTGASKDLLSRFESSGKLNGSIIENDVEMLGYVSEEELDNLYRGCRYLAFTSKAEGYGLPVREALARNKAVLSSWATSIPEVAGAAAFYVNPYSVESIAAGMAKMDEDNTVERYERYATWRAALLQELSEQDASIMVDDLMDLAQKASLRKAS